LMMNTDMVWNLENKIQLATIST